MKTVYVALSLTHVPTAEERLEVKNFLIWLEKTFPINLLRWAFNIDTWTPEPVDDIYEFDTSRVLSSDLMIVLYLSSEGSDGRGGEVVHRVTSGKPVVAFKKPGVKVSRYASDCLKSVGADIMTFNTFEDTKEAIETALNDIGSGVNQPEFIFAG